MEHDNSPFTWTQTYSGRRFDLLNPTPDCVSLRDISAALSKTCRFGGNTLRFYSNAEHSVHVHNVVARKTDSRKARMYALLHDAHEAYIGDMTTPVQHSLAVWVGLGADDFGADKRLLEAAVIDAIRSMKQRMDQAVFKAFGLPAVMPADIAALVKEADLAVLMAERDAVMSDPPDTWGALEDIEPADVLIRCWTPEMAQRKFMDCYGKNFQRNA